MKKVSIRGLGLSGAVLITAISALAVGTLLVLAYCLFVQTAPIKPVVVVMPPQEEEITSVGTTRVVYSQDGKTVLERHIPYRDGSTGHQYFRADGTLRETTEDYAVRDGKPGQLKARASWSADGKTMLFGEVFRPGGNLWFTCKNEGDEKVETFFFADGWRFRTITRKTGKATVTEFLRRDGSTWCKEYRGGNTDTEFYDATGKQVVASLHPMSSNEKFDGFVAPGWGKLVRFYKDGKLSHQQWWNNSWNSFLSQSGSLVFVELFEIGYSASTLASTIYVEDAGEFVKLKEVEMADGSRRIFRNLGGSLKTLALETVNVNGQPKERKLELGTLSAAVDKAGARTEHDAAEGIYENLDRALLMRADTQEFQNKLLQTQSDNRAVLGARDDRDPCKWYHGQW